ncbi:FAD-dependent oxidoreductase [Tenuibacillus multivorans]|uniref:NADPH-dependent 2,4-dienoyl-CoA reductase, sulfur reductase n=1 Tax=Tenuibacillus multivorans TaxID=237069 RepID=A0A1G9YE84_9BACI|nr:FAD-dependent oxidoreductase [Tenuibacillus multivorans]GEL76043.1 NADH dehydrogenase [Tenuibacillus multivorans]SDN06785.1 NADPH-dependent 2,4-dienoyl-CoA reductase, sulfur reductase [Tenuibacillus multivorans]
MKYIIIGGDAAGMSAAMQIVRSEGEHELITLERGEIYSYGQCGLPYAISGIVGEPEDVIARSVDKFRDKYGIDAKVNHDVKQVDTEEKTVSGSITTSGQTFQFSYDKLLIATGANPVMPDWEGIHLNGIFHIKTIPDTNEILDYLDQDIDNVTIVGGGYVGLEMAENFKAIGKDVTIIQRGEQLMKQLDQDMAQLIDDEAKKQEIQVIYGESVKSFSGNKQVEKLHTDQQDYQTDLVLLSVGITPNTQFLGDEFKYGDKGEIIVNEHMQTNVADVFAAGDCASQYHRIKQQQDYAPLGTHANKQGMIAGQNLVGGNRSFKGIVGTSVLKFCDIDIGKTGLSEKEAKQLSIDFDTVKITTRPVAGYYSNKEKLTVKLVYEKVSKTLLGAQIIGHKGVDKRIDVVATALYHNMSTTDLLDLDLSYAPPFNGVWDPIQQAAKRTL